MRQESYDDLTTPEFLRRFERNYIPEPNSGCWLWLGTVCTSYGTIAAGGRSYRAHRASYILHNGMIGRGHVIMHQCDNKMCVNPAHLRAGTTTENVRDYFHKVKTGASQYLKSSGVAPTTAAVHRRKLSMAEVSAIRNSGAPNRTIASAVGVHHTLVSQIKRNLAYASDGQEVAPDPDLAQKLSTVEASRRAARGWHSVQRTRARGMREAGLTILEIATAMGLPPSKAANLAQPISETPLR